MPTLAMLLWIAGGMTVVVVLAMLALDLKYDRERALMSLKEE